MSLLISLLGLCCRIDDGFFALISRSSKIASAAEDGLDAGNDQSTSDTTTTDASIETSMTQVTEISAEANSAEANPAEANPAEAAPATTSTSSTQLIFPLMSKESPYYITYNYIYITYNTRFTFMI